MIGTLWIPVRGERFRGQGDAGSGTSGGRTAGPRRFFSIGEVSALLGIPVPTLRSWERRYGFPQPTRTEGGHRRYGEPQLEQLRRVRDGINPGGRRASEVIREVLVS